MRRRRILTGTDAVVGGALALALLVIVNVMAARFDRRFDWTAKGLNTLDPRTQGILASIQAKGTPVKVAAFFAPQYPWEAELRGKVRELLDAYQKACPVLDVRFIDIYSDHQRAEAVAKEMVGGTVEPNTVAFRCGDRYKAVAASDMAEPEFPDRIKRLKAEDAFSSALQTVLMTQAPRVLCVEGHGERPSAEDKDRGHGLVMFKETLDKAGMALTVGKLGNEPLAGRWDLVVVAGPTASLLPEETEALHQYLMAGGRLLLAAEMNLSQGNKGMEPTGLEALAARWGITVRDEVVIDPRTCIQVENRPVPWAIRTAGFVPDSPAVRGMGAVPMLFNMVRPVEPAEGGVPPGMRVAPMVRSEDSSWAKRELRDLVHGTLKVERNLDRPGPHVLAVQAEVHPEDVPPPSAEAPAGPAALPSDVKAGGRVVVLGDVDVLSSYVIASGQANRDFVLNSVYWLLDRQESIGISAREEETRIVIDQDQQRTLRDTIITVWGGLIVAGVLVWWLRRR